MTNHEVGARAAAAGLTPSHLTIVQVSLEDADRGWIDRGWDAGPPAGGAPGRGGRRGG